MICKYDTLIFQCFVRFNGSLGNLVFLENFEGTNLEYKRKYNESHPNAEKQIFGVSLRRDIREGIEQTDEYKLYIRDKNLNELI